MKVGLFHYAPIDLWRYVGGFDIKHSVPLDKIANLLERCVKMHSPDLVVGSEYLFTEEDCPLDTEQKEGLFERFKKLSKDASCILLPGSFVWDSDEEYSNACPVFHKGKLVKEVHKVAYSSYDQYFRGLPTWEQVKDTGVANTKEYIRLRSFKINGLSFLVEICADHYYSRNRKYTPIPKVADIQVLVAHAKQLGDDETHPSRLFVREGGHFIFCDSRGPRSRIEQVVDGELNIIHKSSDHARHGMKVVEITT
jgi:predicted amidohydrolase